ncbi:MAG: nucleotidyltransferase, partial [Acidobacteria bacterium]|nr:nucleotidyltransferase [Acidobacteriota bacterium]
EQGRSLLDLVGLWQDLEELLGRRVDVVSEGGLSQYLRSRILAEAVPL